MINGFVWYRIRVGNNTLLCLCVRMRVCVCVSASVVSHNWRQKMCVTVEPEGKSILQITTVSFPGCPPCALRTIHADLVFLFPSQCHFVSICIIACFLFPRHLLYLMPAALLLLVCVVDILPPYEILHFTSFFLFHSFRGVFFNNSCYSISLSLFLTFAFTLFVGHFSAFSIYPLMPCM